MLKKAENKVGGESALVNMTASDDTVVSIIDSYFSNITIN